MGPGLTWLVPLQTRLVHSRTEKLKPLTSPASRGLPVILSSSLGARCHQCNFMGACYGTDSWCRLHGREGWYVAGSAMQATPGPPLATILFLHPSVEDECPLVVMTVMV